MNLFSYNHFVHWFRTSFGKLIQTIFQSFFAWMSFPKNYLYRTSEFVIHYFSTECSVLDGYSKYRPMTCPKILKIWWISFPYIGLAHDPEIETLKKLDEFSSDMAWLMTRKTKISEKFLDEFSRICQYGLKRTFSAGDLISSLSGSSF